MLDLESGQMALNMFAYTNCLLQVVLELKKD